MTCRKDLTTWKCVNVGRCKPGVAELSDRKVAHYRFTPPATILSKPPFFCSRNADPGIVEDFGNTGGGFFDVLLVIEVKIDFFKLLK